MCERELETEQRLQHIEPPTLLAITAFLSRSPWLLNRGPRGWTSCRRGYIIICRPPTSCEHHNSHSIQLLDSQGRPLISSTGCSCYLHRCIFFFWQLGRGSYVTHLSGDFWMNLILKYLYSFFFYLSRWVYSFFGRTYIYIYIEPNSFPVQGCLHFT